jgi:hypothetical protein
MDLRRLHCACFSQNRAPQLAEGEANENSIFATKPDIRHQGRRPETRPQEKSMETTASRRRASFSNSLIEGVGLSDRLRLCALRSAPRCPC